MSDPLAKIAALLDAAGARHRSGETGAAEQLYLDALAIDAQHPQALYLLGTLKAQTGSLQPAQLYLEQAVRQAPALVAARVNLGNVQQQLGKLDAAESCYRQALGIDARSADACFGLGRVLMARNDYAQAQVYFEQALACRPAFAPAHVQLGLALRHQGELERALGCYLKALRLDSRLLHVYSELGETLQRLGRAEESLDAWQRYAHEFPQLAASWNNLGNVQRLLARMDEAADSYRRALAIDPSLAEVSNNLGNVLKTLGRIDEAIACYRRALVLKPGFVQAHSNLLLCLNYVPGLDERQIFAEHVHWAATHIREGRAGKSCANALEPQKRLRIGYLSPDFRIHAVARFFEPLLANHDRDRFETMLYAQLARADETTHRLQSMSDHWCCTVGMPDVDLAHRIEADGIDILVDLAGHSARNRLPVLGLRPAPVQVSWLGYPNTTGMTSVDYCLTDAIADPAGAEAFCTEQLVRLPNGLTCYQPPPDAPEPGPLPVLENQAVTFGSLNNLVKLNQAVIALWSRVLEQVSGSRLLLYRDMLRGGVAERVREDFARHGIGGERLVLWHELPGKPHYLAAYRSIDIALDPFPWNGHVTSCEALWMGVPVVTLAGPVHRGRLAASVLHQVGLDALVAADAAEYINIASKLAADPERMAGLRMGLRGRIRASALCDGPGFARQIEDFYRNSWYGWCKSQKPP
jgi:predicted O-linked N-acetylglucosamine transferase (SPINDLY family)